MDSYQWYLAVVFAVTALTVIFTRGFRWQLVTFASLILVALWSYRFAKIGVQFDF